jgi:hypothetical protein
MRGEAERQVGMLTLVQPEHRIPAEHPIRRINALADAELRRLSPVFTSRGCTPTGAGPHRFFSNLLGALVLSVTFIEKVTESKVATMVDHLFP